MDDSKCLHHRDNETNLLLVRLGELRKCKRLPEAKLTLLTAEEKGVKQEGESRGYVRRHDFLLLNRFKQTPCTLHAHGNQMFTLLKLVHYGDFG